MTFLVFEQAAFQGRPILRPTGETFKLAGHNILYRAWEERGKPLNTGWRVTREEMVRLSGQKLDARLIIDFHPTATGRIGLIEPIEIFAYTWANEQGGAAWTPLMLKLRDVFYEEYEHGLTPEQKSKILNEQVPVDFQGEEPIEFLYLNGDDKKWNWGRNGMTNAAFLHRESRDYFRQFF